MLDALTSLGLLIAIAIAAAVIFAVAELFASRRRQSRERLKKAKN